MMLLLISTAQMPMSWHDRGMFMGMHWIWWSFWLLTIAFLSWALWRAVADRSQTRRQTERQEAAEEALRKKYAVGEISEEEYARRMRILRDTATGSR